MVSPEFRQSWEMGMVSPEFQARPPFLRVALEESVSLAVNVF